MIEIHPNPEQDEPAARDSTGRNVAWLLDPAAALAHYAAPCTDSCPVPPGYWKDTRRLRAVLRRGSLLGAAA